MNKGIYRLADITSWDENGNWNAWSLPTLSERDLSNFSAQQKSPLDRMSGTTPIHRTWKETWDWRFFGFHSTTNYFKQIQFSSQIYSTTSSGSHNVAIWKMVWNIHTIAQINSFIWTIMHHKILTGEKILKKGFFGPFRFYFCHQATESSAHIFVECDFAQKFWAIVLRGLPYSFFPLNVEPVTLFKN